MAKTEHDRLRGARWWREIGWRHIVGVVVILYAVFPVVFVVSASLNDTGNLISSSRLFSSISWANYAALNKTQFWQWIVNSLVIGLVTSAGAVLMGSAAAYSFSRFRFRGRRSGLTALLIVQMFPQILTFVAIFLLLYALGDVLPILGLNSRVALIMVYLGGALGMNTFLMYGFFNTVPTELDEAAKVDGASHLQVFFLIILRLVAPVLAVVGLLGFIGTFSDYLLARIILTDQSKWTVAVGLFNFVSENNTAQWGLFSAGAVITAVPVVVLFLVLQRYVVSGLTSGAVKG